MDFFARQEAVRRRSRRLVLLFALAVLGVLLAVNATAWLFLVGLTGRPEATLQVLGLTTLATVVLMGGASLYRILSLRRGGSAVAQAMGGTLVPADTRDANLRRLRNVVEEMAIAAGAPMPQVFVLEHESGINAFAAGFTPADAVIAVTRGALDRLNRSELQAVVAHELGHILQGDTRLNLRLMGWLFGIVVLGLVGRQFLRGGARVRGRNGAPLMMLALLLVVVGWIGLFFARLIKAGISRQREFLADASAVQYTRDPDGLVGAFLKIAGAPEGGHMTSLETEEVSHMLFENGLGLSGFMATHPPLLARIQALRPGFRAARFDDALARQQMPPGPSGLDEDATLALAMAPTLPHAAALQRASPAAVAATAGQWQPLDLDRATALVAALPEVLDAAARDRDEALPLLYALLLSPDAAIRKRQRFELVARAGERAALHADDYAERLRDLHAALKLPVATLALSTLKRRAPGEVQRIADTCFALAHADGHISLFEYALAQMFSAELAASLDPAAAWRRPQRKLPEVEAEVVVLLGLMALAGHDSPAEAQRAFMAALPHVLPQSSARYSPPHSGPAALDDAWPKLDGLLPKAKLALIEALVASASHDGQLRVAEAELLRLVCAVLHAPLPAALTPMPRAAA